MNILRTIIRVLLVAIAIGLFVFLSITLFKFIPKVINQLASATVSIGNTTKNDTDSSTQDTQRTPTLVNPTENGLNGVVIQPVASSSSTGDIVILEKPKAVTKIETAYTSTYKKPTYTYNYTYTPPTYIAPTAYYSNRKNLTLVLSSVGVIDSAGRFVSTNTFRSSDVVSIRYTVINNEDAPTGIWSMQVDMPARNTADRGKLISNIASIPGQSSTVVEARFDGINLSNGTPVFRAYADVNNQVAETSENDNVLTYTLSNVQVDSNYYGNYYYNNDYYYNNNNYYNGNYYSGNIANLVLTTLETGRMYNGYFIPSTSFNYGEPVVLRARVRNTGGAFNTTWSTRGYFSGPESSSREFTTQGEQPITAGGEKYIYYTIDNVGRGTNTFNLTIDNLNNVYETNESDNTASITSYVN